MMFIVINTDEEDKIIDFLKTQDNEKTQYIMLNNADQIQIGTKQKRTRKQSGVSVVQPQVEDTYSSSDCFITKNAKSYEEYLNAIRQKILEPNRLSEEEIREIGYEYVNYIRENKRYDSKFIRCHLLNAQTSWHLDRIHQTETSLAYKQYRELYYLITESLNKQGIKADLRRPRSVDNLHFSFSFFSRPTFFDIRLPISDLVYSHSACGLLNKHFYPVLYYLDNFDIEIKSKKLQRFLDCYKAALDLYGLQYNESSHNLYIASKPDAIFISDSITHCAYTFGNQTEYYCDGLKVPQWLYEAKKEDNLDSNLIEELENVDVRTIFIKKVGIEKFIEKGILIDSYRNYPENEWWAKSEYRLIDMKEILVKKIVTWGSKTKIEKFDYAPFLCMKNQTTGDYHLEGVSPDCRNLYDALKMRYHLLDLPSFEIKNIK